MNVNLYLTNSIRTDLIGKNIASYGSDIYEISDCRSKNRHIVNAKDMWMTPNFGMQGNFIAGHEIPLTDLLTLQVIEGERHLQFETIRHQWTPAWQDTIYRSKVDEAYYPYAGTLCVRERKCITIDTDDFVSVLTITNEKRIPVELTVQLRCLGEQTQTGRYHISSHTLKGAMGKEYPVELDVCTFINGCIGEEAKLHIPALATVEVVYGAAFSPAVLSAAYEKANTILGQNPVFLDKNEKIFNSWFRENVPELICDNEEVKKTYYYRWFLLYRSIYSPQDLIPEHDIKGDCIYESQVFSWFGCPVGFCFPAHVEEGKWMRNPAPILSDLENWCGDSKGYAYGIQYTPMAIWHLFCHHPDKMQLEQIYPFVAAYTKKTLLKTDGRGIPIRKGSWHTGAEYQPSFYQYTEPKWDWRYDLEGEKELGYERKQLYRCDEIAYAILNCRACGMMAQKLGKEADVVAFKKKEAQLVQYLTVHHWNEEQKCFLDVDVDSKKQCDEAICFDSFTPYLYGAVTKGSEYAARFLKNEEQFRVPFSLSTVSKKCPMYWFDNCIAGPTASTEKEPHPYECCWNGPVWPWAVSHTLLAFGKIADGNRNFRDLWLRLFTEYTQLHFLGGDRSLPVMVEHYRGYDGAAFSAIHDYFHSVWLEPFFTYYAGIHCEGEQIHFVPMAREDFQLKNVVIQGRKYDFVYQDAVPRMMEL